VGLPLEGRGPACAAIAPLRRGGPSRPWRRRPRSRGGWMALQSPVKLRAANKTGPFVAAPFTGALFPRRLKPAATVLLGAPSLTKRSELCNSPEPFKQWQSTGLAALPAAARNFCRRVLRARNNAHSVRTRAGIGSLSPSVSRPGPRSAISFARHGTSGLDDHLRQTIDERCRDSFLGDAEVCHHRSCRSGTIRSAVELHDHFYGFQLFENLAGVFPQLLR
jgi:hypothetical protein